MKQFWNWFKENAHTYLDINKIQDKEERDQLLANLLKELHSICDQLYFYIPEFPEDEQELIITANGNSDYFQMAEDLVRSAPSIPDWKFVALMQPDTGKDFHINFKGIVLASNEMYFLPLDQKDSPSSIGLRIGIKNYAAMAANEWLQATVYKIIDTIVGERAFALDIDFIEIDELPIEPKKEGMIELSGLVSYLEWYKSGNRQ